MPQPTKAEQEAAATATKAAAPEPTTPGPQPDDAPTKRPASDAVHSTSVAKNGTITATVGAA